MIDPIEPNLLSSLSTPNTPTPGQTSFSDLIKGMEETAGQGSTEANLLEDWNDQLAGEQGAAAQGIAPNQIALNTTQQNVQNTAAADNSNTGKINPGQMI